MEGKVFSKFYNFMKKFLTMSFLAALAAGMLSFNPVWAVNGPTKIESNQYSEGDSDYDNVYSYNGVVYGLTTSGTKATAIRLTDENAKKATISTTITISDGKADGSYTLDKIKAGLVNSKNLKYLIFEAGASPMLDGSITNTNFKVYASSSDVQSLKTLFLNVKAFETPTVTISGSDAIYYTKGVTKGSEIFEKLKDKLSPKVGDEGASGSWEIIDGNNNNKVYYKYDFLNSSNNKDEIIDTTSLKIRYVKNSNGDIYDDLAATTAITLKERVKASAKKGATDKKVSYNAGKTKWSEVLESADVTPKTSGDSKAKGTWKIIDKNNKTVYSSVKSSNETVPEGVSSVKFAYEAAKDDTFLSAEFDVYLDEKKKILIECNNFNVKVDKTSAEKLGDLSFPAGIKVKESSGTAEVAGTWTWKNSEEKNINTFISEHEALFTPSDSEKYETLTKVVKVINVGETVEFGKHSYNVSSDGVTSTSINSGDFKFVREESDGSAAWYGFDNQSGALPDGSIVSVEWISKKNNPEKYAEVAEKLASEGRPVEGSNLELFQINAFDEDMNEIKNFNGKSLKFYVELGSDWDKGDINAFCADNGIEFVNTNESIAKYTINGEEKEFAVLELKHLSLYGQSDQKTAKDIWESLKNAALKAAEEYMVANPDEKDQNKIIKVFMEAWEKAYEALSEEDKKIYDASYNKDGSEKEKSNNSNNSSTSSSSTSKKTSSTSSTSSGSSTSSTSSTKASSSSKTKTGVESYFLSLFSLFGTSAISTLSLMKRKRD